MKKIKFKKLLVISNENKLAKEIHFESGLNIILGRNKTGKSSLIKSLFHTLGCKVSFESTWKNIISEFLITFEYDKKNFLLKREGQKENYSFYELDENQEPIRVLFKDYGFESYSNFLMNLFDIDIKLMTKQHVEKTITPPLLFNFNYIDQDRGWGSTLGSNFLNSNYFIRWNDFLIKYFIGYQNNKYFSLKNQESILKKKQFESKIEIESINNFITRMLQNYEDNGLEIKESIQQNKDLIKLSTLEKEKFLLKRDINLLRNDIYEINLKLNLVNATIQELSKDHTFSQQQPMEINCPTCGTLHKNTFDFKLYIIEDIQKGNELLHSYRKEKEETNNILTKHETSLAEITKNYNQVLLKTKKNEESISIINTFKAEGRNELIKVNYAELDIMKKKNNEILIDLLTLKNEQDMIISKKRSMQIRNSIKEIFDQLLLELNVSNDNYKIRNFKVSLNDFSGSESPRGILAYYVALYLYNLPRDDFPFKFIVIDTPNQQGQDRENLDLIHKILKNLQTPQGQAIIGTERETGFEQEANLITLNNVRGSLNEKDYNKSRTLISFLENL